MSTDTPLAPFFREMADRFLSRQSNVFLLTGNVDDRLDGLGVSCEAGAPLAPQRYCYLEQYLAARLGTRGRCVMRYNIARGIEFPVPAHREQLREFHGRFADAGEVTSPAERKRREDRFERLLMESQVYTLLALKFLEELFTLARRHRTPGLTLTLIVEHAETLLPDAPLAQMGDNDRQKLTLLTEWFSDPDFLVSPDQVILVAPALASVHETLRRLPHVAPLTVPLPDLAAREAFITWRRGQPDATAEVPAKLAELAAGMTLLTIESLFQQAELRKEPIGDKEVLVALNRLLESELGDKTEVVRPAHTMADVVGATALRGELGRIKALLELRDPSVAPVGILVAGPNGVGKTFVFEAWAAECNRLVIVLKNLRSMYYGQTDVIFEKLRNVLEALGNVIVFIDEADTVFGRPGPNTHETEARLFGSLIRMMGDPRNRGRIVWLLLTARPENLAPDLKRSGRAGLHLPVFDPEDDDRKAYIDHILRRAKVDPAGLAPEQHARLLERTAELSPADFNEVVVELRAERALTGTLTFDQILAVLENILPGQIAGRRRLQTLQALLECSRRSLIPPSLAAIPRIEVEREIERLKSELA